MRARHFSVLLLWIAAGCSSDPCTELCDGIARCREGNAACVAAGATDRDPFMDTCVTQCQASADMLDANEQAESLECLDCLRAQTDFGMCTGETLLDDTCAATCRNDGASAFRNDFGPAVFNDLQLSCLREP
ncbi:MAG: hypothetical protein AB7S26_42285 [Sandaracinaceae bacterium]